MIPKRFSAVGNSMLDKVLRSGLMFCYIKLKRVFEVLNSGLLRTNPDSGREEHLNRYPYHFLDLLPVVSSSVLDRVVGRDENVLLILSTFQKGGKTQGSALIQLALKY